MRAGTGVVAALIIVLGGAGGFLAAHLLREHHTERAGAPAPRPQNEAATAGQFSNDSQAGAASPDLPGKRPIPEQVPDISLPDAAGQRHSLRDWRGHLLLINFWATWCEPCRREIPLLERLRREHAAEGLEVVGVAVDFRDAVLRYVHDMAIEYPILMGEQNGLEAISAFGMDAAFPFTVFADRQTRIIALKIGELHEDEVRMILARAGALEQGRLTLAQARTQIDDELAKLALKRAQTQPSTQ